MLVAKEEAGMSFINRLLGEVAETVATWAEVPVYSRQEEGFLTDVQSLSQDVCAVEQDMRKQVIRHYEEYLCKSSG